MLYGVSDLVHIAMVVGTSHSESSMLKSVSVQDHFKDLKQDCSNSIANAVTAVLHWALHLWFKWQWTISAYYTKTQ